MSRDRSRRAFDKIDYKVYHKTGKKVVKESRELDKISEKFKQLATMANEKIVDEENKVCMEINRFIDEKDFELLFDIEEIEISICELIGNSC